jgi:transposase
METKASNIVKIQQLIRKATAAGWSVVKHGKTYPTTKCLNCGDPTALLFERNGVRKDRCFRCGK